MLGVVVCIANGNEVARDGASLLGVAPLSLVACATVARAIGKRTQRRIFVRKFLDFLEADFSQGAYADLARRMLGKNERRCGTGGGGGGGGGRATRAPKRVFQNARRRMRGARPG